MSVNFAVSLEHVSIEHVSVEHVSIERVSIERISSEHVRASIHSLENAGDMYIGLIAVSRHS